MKKRILIIDNDKDFVEILKCSMKKKGYDAICAYNGMDGVKQARHEKPDLIILDIMLPEMDGYSISRLLKFDLKYKNIPIIIFSSKHGDSAAMSSEVGADAYVTKSADAGELFEKIESLLKGETSRRLDIEIEGPPVPLLKKGKRLKEATIGELRAKIKRLTEINEAIYDINRTLEIDACIKKLIEKASSILAAEISSIMLLDRKENELVLRLAKGVKDDIVKKTRMKLGEGIAGKVAKEAKPLLVEDVKKYPGMKRQSGRSYKTDSFISVPLMVGDEVLGVVNVTDKIDKTNFTKEDLATLMSIASNAASSIKNSTIYEELKRINLARSDFVSTLSHEMKEPLLNVQGSIDQLLRDSQALLSEGQIEFLTAARRNIEKLLRLIEELPDISRLEAERP